MVVQLLKKLFSIVGTKDYFLVIEVLPEYLLRVSSVILDKDKKELLLKNTVDLPAKNGALNLASLKKAFRKAGSLDKYKIVVGLDSQYASTVYSTIALVRNNAKDLIDEVDLDNLISQAVWKFFDRHRLRVAQKLGINDFDVLLTDVRINNVRLDGHRILNPVGFRARTIEFRLFETFTSRQVINDLKNFLPVSNIKFISESGAAWARIAASRIPAQTDFLMANIFFNKTTVFSADDVHLSHQENLRWGAENIFNALAADLKVDFETSRKIFEVYRNDQVSAGFARKLDRVLMEELGIFAARLKSFLSGSGTRLVYFHSYFDLPQLVFSPTFRGRMGFSGKLEQLTHNFISENQGFNLKFNKQVDPRISFGIFSMILEANAESSYAVMHHMSQMAKRRVRWLTPL